MVTIGFTTQFYTLWNVTTREEYLEDGRCYQVTDHWYQQNLSMDLDAAKAKAEKFSEVYEINLELRGCTRFTTKKMIKDFDVFQFTFGRLTGSDMRLSDDVWQLQRAMNDEPNARRRVIARARLLELGAIVKYTWIESVVDMKKVNWDLVESGEHLAECRYDVIRKYCPAKKAEFIQARIEREKLAGHYFENGKRVVVEVKEINRFHFDTQYGTTYIREYITPDGQLVKYKGGNPIHIENHDVFTKIKGTVEHGEYKGVKETRIKRVAIVS